MEFFDALFYFLLPPFALLFFLFGLDDLFVDLWAWIRKARPQKVAPSEIESLLTRREKRIAIVIASWQEGGVLERMVTGNLESIRYQNFDFFLGVYPNDPATLREARSLESQHENVHVIINRKNGPTSKGQMINEIVRSLLLEGKNEPTPFDAILLHDSEDLIHPLSLKVTNWKLEKSDFIQIPVLPLETQATDLVSGIYRDEFAESHTKTLLVRQSCGSPLPSAGVGTALSSRLIQTLVRRQDGLLMSESTLTEDYDLGVRCDRAFFSPAFASYYFLNEDKKREFIATRAFFPKSLLKSVRQKTRWNYGIGFQGMEQIGWIGGLSSRYFLYRDRKAPLSNILSLLGFLIALFAGMRTLFYPSLMNEISPLLRNLLLFNLFLMAQRGIERMRSTLFVYGGREALLAPLRLCIGNFINAAAALAATRQFIEAKLLGISPIWVKTEHELPIGFGLQSNQEGKA